MSQENNNLTGHEYDGIQELDNPLPGWWLWTFLGTIIFAFIYFIHFEISGVTSSEKELEIAMTQIQMMKKGGPVRSEEKLAAVFNDDAIKKGHDLFANKCAACHGQKAEGLIGPNLTDKNWLNGQGTRMDVVKIIGEGVPAKGMPAWAEQVSEDDLVAISSFVYSIKGTFAPGGKAPQGGEYP